MRKQSGNRTAVNDDNQALVETLTALLKERKEVLTAALPAKVVTAARDRGKARDLRATAQELLVGIG